MADEVSNLAESKLTALIVDDSSINQRSKACIINYRTVWGVKSTSSVTAKKPLTFIVPAETMISLTHSHGHGHAHHERYSGEVRWRQRDPGLNDFQEKPLTISKLLSILHKLDFYVQT